ncbi:sulfate transporter family-domain-containing protein [Paraphysoderma sedebokerense]|nr:sulfate transporter family-domain-containing protein [Paraphysoderma sedebokerense]
MVQLPTLPPSYKARLRSFPRKASAYSISLIPIISWLPAYRFRKWALGDIIAGLTVGIMVIPQSMAYALLAGLPIEYGLYSAFLGVFIYTFFGTSKDITIGPTAVMSLLIGQILGNLVPEINKNGVNMNVATVGVVTFVSSVIMTAMGLLRLGIVIDFIPDQVIAGFTSAAAITIIVSQSAKLLGIPNVSTKDPTYTILYNTFASIPKSNPPDLYFSLATITVLVSLQLFKRSIHRHIPASTSLSRTQRFISKIQSRPRLFKAIDLFCTARNAIVVIIFTAISYAINISIPNGDLGGTGSPSKGKSPFKILKTVPGGFPKFEVPRFDLVPVSSVLSSAIVVVLIVMLEQLAICQAFARRNNYKVVPSQEFIAVGVSNFATAFVSTLPVTGSFSRSAVNSASGVQSPLSGIISSSVVVVCMVAITKWFYYIPDAVLSGIIVVSVAGLISEAKMFKLLWRIQPWDFIIGITSLIATLIVGLETGIQISVALAVAILLFRVARPQIHLLGRLVLPPINNPPEHIKVSEITKTNNLKALAGPLNPSCKVHPLSNIYVPYCFIDYGYVVTPPPPGVLVVKLQESLTFPNAEYVKERVWKMVVTYTSSIDEHNKAKADAPASPDKRKRKIWSDDLDDVVRNLRIKEWNKRRERAEKVENALQANYLQDSNLISWLDTEVSKPSFSASSSTLDTPKEASKSGNTQTSHDLSIPIPTGHDAPKLLPILKSLVFDFSSVNQLDSSGLQALLDLQRTLQRYSGNPHLQFQFVNVHPNVEKVLVLGGMSGIKAARPSSSSNHDQLQGGYDVNHRKPNGDREVICQVVPGLAVRDYEKRRRVVTGPGVGTNDEIAIYDTLTSAASDEKPPVQTSSSSSSSSSSGVKSHSNDKPQSPLLMIFSPSPPTNDEQHNPFESTAATGVSDEPNIRVDEVLDEQIELSVTGVNDHGEIGTSNFYLTIEEAVEAVNGHDCAGICESSLAKED